MLNSMYGGCYFKQKVSETYAAIPYAAIAKPRAE